MFAAPDRLHGVPGKYNYYRCNSCKTVFQNPVVIQEDISICYPRTYYTHQPSEARPQATNIFENLVSRDTGLSDKLRKSIIKQQLGRTEGGRFALLVGRLLSRSRILRERAFYGLLMDELLPNGSGKLKALEIGCGSGELLKKLSLVGWQIEGVEWDEAAASVAEQYSGQKVHSGDLRALNLEPNRYELILMHHVFEHLSQPVETLQEIHRILEPGGRAVLVYPNPQSLNTMVFNSFWYHWDPPRHLIFPQPSSMRQLAERLGFRVYWRTLSRYAAEGAAQSRRYKKGLEASASVKIDVLDSFIKSAQTFLIWLGLPVGEEALVVLEKRNDSSCRSR